VNEPATIPTVNIAERVYGSGVDASDPAELLHEASKLWPATIGRQMSGVQELDADAALQASSMRAVRRNPALETVELPAAEAPSVPLADVLSGRRSVRRFAETPLSLHEVAVLLRVAYGITSSGRVDRPALRAAPSAGALYPLELYVAAQRVDNLNAGVYHYDPLEDVLRRVADAAPDAAALSPHADIVAGAAATLIVSAVFWRSRFKYGLRAYRFTLLEAGHATQNALLAATALGVGSIVLGGFYDGRIDALLGNDGVNESALVLVCLGRPA
jgi:SagB-type dehydrogenase family enzyme